MSSCDPNKKPTSKKKSRNPSEANRRAGPGPTKDQFLATILLAIPATEANASLAGQLLVAWRAHLAAQRRLPGESFPLFESVEALESERLGHVN